MFIRINDVVINLLEVSHIITTSNEDDDVLTYPFIMRVYMKNSEHLRFKFVSIDESRKIMDSIIKKV